VYFADIDSDQLMESTDKVIVAQWQSGAVTSNIWGYVDTEGQVRDGKGESRRQYFPPELLGALERAAALAAE